MHRVPSLFKACAFIFAATAVVAGVAQAADSKLDNVLKRGHLIVGTGSTNAPWHFQGADGKLQGFDIDIGAMIAKGLFNDASKVEYVVQSSDARIPNLLTDKVDISCQFITVTASRAQQVAFTLPYYREGVGLLLPANSKYKEIDDLRAAGDKVTVAVLQNVYAEELVHQALPKAKVDQYDSVDLMYQAVNSGRADTAATDQSSVKYLMVQNPGRYRSPAYAWSPQTYACAVKRGDQDWLNFVNVALHESMTGVEFPAYAASFKKWFGVDLPSPQIGFPVEFK
ncbi:transporter substrate-binding domain-containing protein [Pseudomonas agarici]|uniref:transporter substrate-binding domain-containing protein n=1 Tax=Pseudomonas agarici TaxID=46677 RepID=UPI0002DFC709|nr:transporter substrate-binding domain-containing protein [Pseudomonas agarici]NWB93259.1 transporter substrate-binding domain-containing protein [Pseudomonas agarici]NWC08368.1 transporter substrate-binding domain-containing protein [Pseudomonas agarici]SEK64859.1 amino acid ABC transporter substrate-binding protein, PAAT family [Pseudomonas agarici]